MADINIPQDNDNEIEQFPVEPRYHPVNRFVRSIYDILASAKLAMLLLITILLCCLIGVTVYRGDRASEMVFGTLWFNGLLVLLVTNTACCFFGRMWRRKITVVSFGMILFHLSFVVTFLAIVGNSLFYFDGKLRLTEGETLVNSDPKSYDSVRHGLLFSYSRLRGETTLLRVHRGFKVDGSDKQIAFDISVAEGTAKQTGTIYITNKFVYKGTEYIRESEGYSLLTILNGRQGNELYGAHFPLQSFKQKDGSYLYSTGTIAGPEPIGFPPEKDKALFGLQLDYLTDSQKDRNGRVRFQVWPAVKMDGKEHSMAQGAALGSADMHTMNTQGNSAMATGGGHKMSPEANGAAGSSLGKYTMKQLANGTANIGEKFIFSDYELYVPEVRYWVAINVSNNPGKPFVLASLCIGLTGMIITTIGRMMRGQR